MSDYYNQLAETLRKRLNGKITDVIVAFHEVTVVANQADLHDVCQTLHDDSAFHCEQVVDICGVDYSTYDNSQWEGPRFAVAYQLLSIKNNHRIRVKTFVDGEPPVVDSVIDIWKGADWFEREAFDLFGIIFDGHPDLRRILTDYGFIGHPFRKDFPLSGNVEMRYDEEQKRVIYQPVSIDPRVNQPRVIREDHRYAEREAALALNAISSANDVASGDKDA